jgi:hypothetical protein
LHSRSYSLTTDDQFRKQSLGTPSEVTSYVQATVDSSKSSPKLSPTHDNTVALDTTTCLPAQELFSMATNLQISDSRQGHIVPFDWAGWLVTTSEEAPIERREGGATLGVQIYGSFEKPQELNLLALDLLYYMGHETKTIYKLHSRSRLSARMV